jgi:hypothetical protein
MPERDALRFDHPVIARSRLATKQSRGARRRLPSLPLDRHAAKWRLAMTVKGPVVFVVVS